MIKTKKKKATLLKTKTKKLGKVRSSKAARLLKRGIIIRKTKKDPKRNGATPKPAPPKPLTPEMIEIRSRLVAMLTETRRDIDHEVRGASERDLAHINDTSDMASDAAEGDLSLRIAESETAEASEIERAIEKVDNGTYGICEVCNNAIGVDRLKFLPYVTMCIKCQELAEIRRREDGDELEDLADSSDMDDNN